MGIHLALLQTDIKFCDFEYNAAHVIEMIADAMEKVPRPDVIVLPEDWSSGFSDEMFHHMEEHIAVSYTHLDVYKRQKQRRSTKIISKKASVQTA